MKIKSKRNGFTLIETLVAMFACMVVALLGMSLLQFSLKFSTLDLNRQNLFSILQLRYSLSIAKNIQVEENQLNYSLNYKEYTIYFDAKNRLVKTPGYEILMLADTNGTFYEKDNEIYLQIEEKSWQLR